ncbi:MULTISPECIES: DUF2894 domain-containing protein [Cupriavidus]|uniref:DUF2894 domain-containing protein n=1 Tax=Cupriavidus sp. DF5525 TaxID=3160989 RepID=UPI0003B023A9|nr:hypothetical protein N234_22725 [Ralstonia pickettii DTP0602]
MDSGKNGDVRATLEAWRERGADRLDPVRFRFIEALARRAAGHSGAARRLLDDRLASLVEAYGKTMESAACEGVHASSAVLPRKPAAGMLAGLVGHMQAHAQPAQSAPATRTPLPRRPAPVEPELVDYFRDTWARVSVDRQLRQSLEHVPEHAGPLNSNHLVHRSLSLMREMSPGYLHQFLSYVDAMSWLEQLHGGGALPDKEAARAGSAKKTVRGKARK